MVNRGIYIINAGVRGGEEGGVELKTEKSLHINVVNTTGDKIYEYDEAIDLTGNGCYSCGLLAVLSLSLLSMGLDIFGFSVIVTGSGCDFQLENWQRSILLSMPLVGPILMSITWGYVADTQGRRKALLIALWGAFIISTTAAFSVNWIMLAVLKVFSSSFSSAVQSLAYALLNESCSNAVKGIYLLIMTSVLMLFLLSYVVPAYFVLQFSFSYDLGIITFTPWRLLNLLMTAPLGICAFLAHFYYESPKFLVNVGREDQALSHLANIWARNGGKTDEYPVRRVVLNEERSAKSKDISFIRSLFQQIVPLFRPPLLWRSLQLFYLTAVIYCINNSLVMWMPYIIEAFTAGSETQNGTSSRSLCSILIASGNVSETAENVTCSSSIGSHTLLSGIIHGLVFSGITLLQAKIASRRKALMILFLLVPALSSLGAIFNENNLASLILYVGMTMTNLCMGVLFSYYVDLYPTSYSGMIACLGVMVARLSGLAGIVALGSFMMTHCTLTLYVFTGFLISGILVAIFLPPDIKPKKV